MNKDRLFENLVNKKNLEQAFDYLLVEIENSSLAIDPIWTPALLAIKKNRKTYFNALSELLINGYFLADKAKYFKFPKDNLGIRPVAILSVTDRIVYQAIFLKPVLGNVLKPKYVQPPCYTPNLSSELEKTYLEDWHQKWDDFINDQIKAYKEGYIYKVDLDVKSFFDNINHDLVKEFLVKECNVNGTKVIEVLMNLLSTWAHKPGFGIPQGPEASIFIASAFLSQLDDKGISLNSELEFRQFRYNDDICLMAKTPEALHQLIEILSNYLFDIFLELNGKTSFCLLDEDEVLKLAKRRIYSPYGINEDSLYTVLNIENSIPDYLSKLKDNRQLEQYEVSALKYYLKGAKNRAYCTRFIDLLDKSHSLSLYICRYIQKFVDDKSVYMYLCKTYSEKHLYSWSKFWVLKTLISSKHFQDKENIVSSKTLILNGLNDKSWEIRSLCLYIAELFGFISDSSALISKLHKSADNIFEKSMTTYLLGSKNESGAMPDLLRSDCTDLQIIAFSALNKPDLSNLPNDLSPFSQYLLKINDTSTVSNSTSVIQHSLLDLVSEGGAVHISLDTSKLSKELGLTWNQNNSGRLKRSKKIVHWIELHNTGELVMDGAYILSKPNIDSENECFISYVINRSGKNITKKDIENDQNIKLTRSFNNILNDLGFKGEIKKLFFPVTSASQVRFFRKLKQIDVASSSIDEKKLERQLKKLRPF